MTPEEELELLQITARARARSAQPEARVEQRRENAQERVDTLEDVGRSLVTGVQQGVAGLVALPRDLNDLSANWAEDNQVFGDNEGLRRFLFGTPSTPENPGWIPWPSSGEVNRAIESMAGEQHEPQTTAGEYARTIGQFAPAAISPGSLATRATRTVVPAVASETAGQLTEGTALETPARIVAGVGAGVATEASIAANAQRAAARQARAGAESLEREFGPMTAGERSANPRMRLDEDDMRRGMGSDQAQRTMQGFDDRRAPEISANLRAIATRGQEPLTEDLGAAGTTLSDALRTRVDNMRAQQSRLYEDAFNLAQNERVAANEVADELIQRVNRVVENDFLDVGPSIGVIQRAQAQISSGQATYATIERARQALNRQLGAALKSGDDNAVYGIGRVIDELDAFVAPRLSREASRAVTEARGFTREMLNQFGQRTRTDLSTGHVGRSDPGGRAIERVLNTDLTGEQVIDAILGSGTRPSQQTLGAVRRIREINDTIATTNRNAAAGARLPGRSKKGGQTAGERRFAADSPDARYGVELPNPELQAVREALFHRILRPMDARNPGGMIPAQSILTNMRRALDGPGKEITEVIFTPREIGAMRRAVSYLEALTPPPGTAVSGTPPGLMRAFSKAFDNLVGFIPGFGPVLRQAVENATSTNVARAAVRPLPPPSSKPSVRIEQPSRVAPGVGGAAAISSASQNQDRR